MPNNTIITLFILGFIKHFFGYLLGLHTYYCKFGNQCIKYNKHSAIWHILIVESILEGIIFVMFGSFFGYTLSDNFQYNASFFMFLGFFLHISAEIIGIHNQFCINNCI